MWFLDPAVIQQIQQIIASIVGIIGVITAIIAVYRHFRKKNEPADLHKQATLNNNINYPKSSKSDLSNSVLGTTVTILAADAIHHHFESTKMDAATSAIVDQINSSNGSSSLLDAIDFVMDAASSVDDMT